MLTTPAPVPLEELEEEIAEGEVVAEVDVAAEAEATPEEAS